MENKTMYLYNLELTRLCDLYNNNGTSPRNVTVSKKINEITQLSFDLSFLNPYLSVVFCGMLVEFDGQIYEITNTNKQHNEDNSIVFSVTCQHYSSSLRNRQILEEQIDPKVALDALKAILYDNTTPKYGWTVDTVSVGSEFRGYDLKEQSVFETLVQIAELFKAHLEFSSQIINNALINSISLYAIDDYQELTPLRIDVNKNLKNVDLTYDASEMVTRLYCFGGTNPLTEMDIDLLGATVLGQPYSLTYIENYDYYLNQGYIQGYIDAHKNTFLREGVWRDSDYYDSDMLYADAVKKLETLSKPKINIKFSSVNLQEDYYGFGSVKIGSPVIINDSDINLSLQCIVIGITRNFDTPWLYDFEISNIIEYKSVLSKIFQASAKMSYTLNTDGTIKAEIIDIGKISADKIIKGKFVSQNNLVSIDLSNGEIRNTTIIDGKTVEIVQNSFEPLSIFVDDVKIFGLDDNGNLDITGKITAFNGDIGGWTINNDSLTSELTKNIYINTGGSELGDLSTTTGLETTSFTYKRTEYISINPVSIDSNSFFVSLLDSQQWRVFKYDNNITNGNYGFLGVYPSSGWATGDGNFTVTSDTVFIRLVYQNTNYDPDIIIPIKVKTELSSSTGLRIDRNGYKVASIDEGGYFEYKKSPIVLEIPTLNSPLTDWDGSTDAPTGYYEDNGRTYLEGVIRLNGAVPQFVVFTLPEGYRPSKNQYLIGNSNNGAYSLMVNPSGQIIVINSNGNWISLCGISFKHS